MRLQQLIQPITEDSSKDKIVSSTGEKKLYRAVVPREAEKIATTDQFIPRVSDGNADMGRAVSFLSFSRSPSGQYVAKQHGMQVVFEIDQEKLERHLQRQNRAYSIEPFVYGSDSESRKLYRRELEERLNLLDDSAPIGNLKKFTRAVHIFIPKDVVGQAQNPVTKDPDAEYYSKHKIPTPFEITQRSEETIVRINLALGKLGIRTHLYLDRNDFLHARVHKSFSLDPQHKTSLRNKILSALKIVRRPLNIASKIF